MERAILVSLALIAILSLWLAPWAATTRAVGAKSTVVLIPNRTIDFTGRSEPLDIPLQNATLILSLAGLGAISAAGFTRKKIRLGTWLVAGIAISIMTFVSLAQLNRVIAQARLDALVSQIQDRLDNPNDRMDVPRLQAIIADAENKDLESTRLDARDAGVNINARRLPYVNPGMGAAAFLTLLSGFLAILFSSRLSPTLGRWLDRFIAIAAVPLISILLALVATAFVILLLQETPINEGVELSSFEWLVGRIDTVWYAFQTLFADSLGSLSGFMESLKFTTPLIFTGLAVAFGFQAGLFNIGAPGQMVLGAIFAMFAGIYMPGPRFIVIPVAIFACALGGGLWGAIPGWLKARFGANEVINTILMNNIAASLLLFMLSSNLTFAAPALRAIWVILGASLLGIIISLIAPLRRALAGFGWRRVSAVAAVLVLIIMTIVALPQPGDGPISFELPFKAPGSEPKSYPLSENARLPQLPAILGIDLEESPGTNDVPVNYGLLIAPILALLGFALLPRLGKRWSALSWRLGTALGLGVLGYLVTLILGLTRMVTAIPPTKLNVAFLIALASAVVMYYLMWRTKWGYELRAVGLSPKAAEYGGASIANNTILAMTISGAFAGLSACHYVLGGALEEYALRQAIPASDGFDGIAVALLGGNTPLGVVLSAFLFGILKHGGSVLNVTFNNLTRDVVSMVLALVVLFIAARGFLPERFTNPLKRSISQDTLASDEDQASKEVA